MSEMNDNERLAARVQNYRHLAEVIEAYINERTIQYSERASLTARTWVDRNINTDTIKLEFSGDPTLYRLKPVPTPKLPDGVFWIRPNKTDKAMLVISVGPDGVMTYSYGAGGLRPLSYEFLFNSYLWSHDRVKWFTFTGTEVKL